MKTTRPARSDSKPELEFPAGTEVLIVDWLGQGNAAAIAEVRIPDETLVGGARYDTITIERSSLSGVMHLCDECFTEKIQKSEDLAIGVLAPKDWRCDWCLGFFDLGAHHPHSVYVEKVMPR